VIDFDGYIESVNMDCL